MYPRPLWPSSAWKQLFQVLYTSILDRMVETSRVSFSESSLVLRAT